MKIAIRSYKNIWISVGSIFSSVGPSRSYRMLEVPTNGFAQDAQNLSNDFRRVAGDMRKAVDYANQQHQPLNK